MRLNRNWLGSASLVSFVAVAWLIGPPAGAQQVSTSSPGEWTMGLRRAGPLQFGMSLDEVRRILGEPQASLTLDGVAQPLEARCAYLSSAAVPQAMTLMFSRGILARIDVLRPGPRTELGAQVGDAENAVLQMYRGRIDIGLHPFLADDAGHYLMYRRTRADEHDYGLTFETRDGRVTSYRVGRLGSVTRIDGCRS